MKSLRVLRVFGINILLHYSWFFVFILLTLGLSLQFFPSEYVGLSQTTYWTLGVISSLFLFISVLIHEICHSLVAKHYGIGVKQITLFFFGGMAHVEGEEKLTPKIEFLMTLAGPLSSLVLGVFFFIIISRCFMFMLTISIMRMTFTRSDCSDHTQNEN